MRTLTHDDYTVGWICAVSMELAASMSMLDEAHSPLPAREPDSNTYTLGRIGEHNVVMACLPAGQIGTSPAATVATNMKNSFKMIRFGLLVGIGGGVPYGNRDIRLGDVVVSKPTKKNGGVVQYDFGKIEHNEKFKRTDSLNAPPQVLLTAVNVLRANHGLGRNRMAHYISQIPPSLPTNFTYPGAEQDKLFEDQYVHPGGDTCDNCDVSMLKERPSRSSSDPVVHYGTIASGNQVIKDVVTRKRLASDEGALCFEMEAAGLMNNFPCVVIRGICDYSDSHKNKLWQPYAAATAAAYAKDLLSVIPPKEVADTTPIPTPVPTPVPRPVPSPSPSPFREGSGTDQLENTQPSTASTSFFSQYHLFPPNSVVSRAVGSQSCDPDEDFCPSTHQTHQRRHRDIVSTSIAGDSSKCQRIHTL